VYIIYRQFSCVIADSSVPSRDRRLWKTHLLAAGLTLTGRTETDRLGSRGQSSGNGQHGLDVLRGVTGGSVHRKAKCVLARKNDTLLQNICNTVKGRWLQKNTTIVQ